MYVYVYTLKLNVTFGTAQTIIDWTTRDVIKKTLDPCVYTNRSPAMHVCNPYTLIIEFVCNCFLMLSKYLLG